jgi:hypothetical protein
MIMALMGSISIRGYVKKCKKDASVTGMVQASIGIGSPLVEYKT